MEKSRPCKFFVLVLSLSQILTGLQPCEECLHNGPSDGFKKRKSGQTYARNLLRWIIDINNPLYNEVSTSGVIYHWSILLGTDFSSISISALHSSVSSVYCNQWKVVCFGIICLQIYRSLCLIEFPMMKLAVADNRFNYVYTING